MIIQKFTAKEPGWILKCFIFVMIVGLLYLGASLCILYGALKERKNKNCIAPSELLIWQNTLELAQAVCVDVQQNQLGEIKNIYEVRTKLAEDEADKWKSYYLSQKEQYEKTQKENAEEITEQVEGN